MVINLNTSLRDKALKIFSLILILFIVVILILYVLGHLTGLFFWVSVAIIAFWAYFIIPRLRAQNPK